MNAFSFLLLSSLVLCLSAKDRFLQSADLDPHCDLGLDADGNQVIKSGLFDIGIPCDTNFYQCNPESGLLYKQPCPGGDVFVASLGYCVPAIDVKGCGQSVLPECDGGVDADGVQKIKTDPFSKGIACDSHFYQCNPEGSIVYTFSCFVGGIFDVSLGTCAHRNDIVGCESSVDPQCDLGVDANGYQLIRSGRFGTSCGDKYHECDPITGVLSTTACGSGAGFDVSLQNCNNRELVAGCKPVCHGWDGENGYIVPEDCRASFICPSLSIEWCPEGTYSGWNGECHKYNRWICDKPHFCPMYPADGSVSMAPYTYNIVATEEDCTGKDANIAYALTATQANIDGNDFIVCNADNQAIHYYCCYGYSVVLESAPICQKRE
jgi:hypothetical protein